MFGNLFKTRARTSDKESPSSILTVEKIGPKRHLTPEGFLLCLEVPIARTGEMLYGPGEVPLKEGSDGIIRVTRGPADLFAEDTISSMNGKSVVNEHPADDQDVGPSNWKQLTVGIMFNVRRGTDENHDVLIGDLLITDRQAIADVLDEKREVSLGYEADYTQTGPGRGKQTSIMGNHIALVERGRCGPRCAIGDHDTTSNQEHQMPTLKKARRVIAQPVQQAVRKLFTDAAEEAMNVMQGDMPSAGGDDDGDDDSMTSGDGHTHIHIHAGGEAAPAAAPTGGDNPMDGAQTTDDPVEARFAAIEGTQQQILEQLAALAQAITGGGQDGGDTPPPDEGGDEPPPDDTKDAMNDEVDADDKSAKTTDSAALSASFAQVIADAEILVPGFRYPTFDARAKRRSTIDTMCTMRKRVLDHLYSTATGKQLLDTVSGEKFLDLSKTDCASGAVLFKAAAGAKRMLNNQTSTRDANSLPVVKTGAAGKVQSLADLNRQNEEYYKTHK